MKHIREGNDVGIIELATIGTIIGIVLWTIASFIQTIVYGALTSATAFAGHWLFVMPVDQSVAQPLLNVMGYGVNTVDIVIAVILFAAWKFFLRFCRSVGPSTQRCFRIFA